MNTKNVKYRAKRTTYQQCICWEVVDQNGDRPHHWMIFSRKWQAQSVADELNGTR